MKISVVVCTYQRPNVVVRLLDAVDAQTRLPDEVLVVDGSHDDRTEAVLADRAAASTLRYRHAAPEERGLTRQRNLAIDLATGDVLAFVDDDTVPEPGYLEAVERCFERRPDAIGVGGYVLGIGWQPVPPDAPPDGSRFRVGGWERTEASRWRLRRSLGLDSTAAPGRMPPSGHGRPLTYLPPDGQDHGVDFLIGCAMAFRRDLFERERFSSDFEGYGLYEDLDFSTRARRHGALVLCGAARIHHHHEPAGRPRHFRYGTMVSRNGWRVWRGRWPRPPLGARFRWWATSLLLALVRLSGVVVGPGRGAALQEAAGRIWGLLTVLVRPPRPTP